MRASQKDNGRIPILLKNNSFMIQILRTEHRTWQGRIGHVQTGKSRSFRSCLEMIQIMTELIEKKGGDADALGSSARQNGA